jgi:peptidoglycan-associated lipoprotein
MKLSRLVLLLPAALAAIAGCSSTNLAQPTAAAPLTTAAAPTPAQLSPPAAPAQPAQSTVKTVTLNPLDDPRSSLAKRSVYFDFDSFLIQDADRPLIDAHAKYLASSRTAKVRIEGNADERGGREYNLALGQRRAEAVLKSLTLLGAPTAELEATSFGKEKPVDTGHNETAWVKNRRADLNYFSR